MQQRVFDKQLFTKCLFHLLTGLFITHLLCSFFAPDTMPGTGDTEEQTSASRKFIAQWDDRHISKEAIILLTIRGGYRGEEGSGLHWQWESGRAAIVIRYN